MRVWDQIIELIDTSIRDDAENLITAGNIIKSGYNSEVDELRSLQSQGHFWISEYQARLIQETKISSLKIKYTQNFGYFIELTKNHSTQAPQYFILKQSLLQVSRYTTEELQAFETKLFSSEDTLIQKEYALFLEIRATIKKQYNEIYAWSRNLEYIDYLSNGAYLSAQRNYIFPHMTQDAQIQIEAWKHPTISLKQKDFISNSLSLHKKEFIHVITGPNMGGKSTFLRQNALLILMAHMGYPIPAWKAQITKVDKIFSRVWAGDNLFLGQSTFMVEMQEIAYILRNATSQSFIIIDEIGRGTSTYDGMSLAWSILEHIQKNIGAKTLFATHYHEIIDHAGELPWVRNYSVAVGENNESIVFLRKIIPGGIKKSYGVEVAKLAGIPEKVLENARKMMKSLELGQSGKQLTLSLDIPFSANPVSSAPNSLSKIERKLQDINVNQLTPLDALHLIVQFQEEMKKIK